MTTKSTTGRTGIARSGRVAVKDGGKKSSSGIAGSAKKSGAGSFAGGVGSGAGFDSGAMKAVRPIPRSAPGVGVMTYAATATRDGEWWVISVPQVRGVHSQARRLDQVEAMAREALALVLEVDDDSVEVEYSVVLPDDISEVPERVAAARLAAEAAAKKAAAATSAGAEALKAAGYSVRDIGALLNISFQRAAQLLG